MLGIEKKLLDFVQKHIAVLGIACLLLVSAVIRYFLLPYHSIDYVSSLEVWYENFRSFGVLGIAAVWLISRRVQFGVHTTLLLFIFSFYTCLIFLPGMHERYGMAVLVLLVVYTAASGRLAPLTACMAAMDTMIYIPFLLQGAMPVGMSTLSVLNVALYGAFCFAFLRELRAEGALPVQN